jgi:hypothetical protein
VLLQALLLQVSLLRALHLCHCQWQLLAQHRMLLWHLQDVLQGH